MKHRKARRNPTDPLAGFRVIYPGYPEFYRLYAGRMDFLNALIDSGYRIPLPVFLVLSEELPSDPRLILGLEVGGPSADIFVDRLRSGAKFSRDRDWSERVANLTMRQLEAFLSAGMIAWNKKSKKSKSQRRVLYDLT